MRSSAYVTSCTLAQATARWLSFVRDRVAPRPHLTIDVRRSVLLVMDMQRYFCNRGGRCYLPATEAIVPNVVNLVDAWRAQGGVALATQHGHTGRHDLGMLGRFYSDYIRRGESEAQLISPLSNRLDQVIVEKSTYDAFWETELEAELRALRVTQVLIAGVLTHLCCETTARSAFCRGFEVYIAADATASSSEELHQGSLLAVADGVGIVMSTEEILQTLGHRGR